MLVEYKRFRVTQQFIELLKEFAYIRQAYIEFKVVKQVQLNIKLVTRPVATINKLLAIKLSFTPS